VVWAGTTSGRRCDRGDPCRGPSNGHVRRRKSIRRSAAVPGTYGCPQAGKENFILGTSAEVAGLTPGSAIKRVLTADGRATPTHRDKRQVCSTQAIVIPPGYPPIAGTTPLDKAYSAWLALNPSGLRDEQMESGAPTHYDPLTLCEYMGGSGQCSSVLAADYRPNESLKRIRISRSHIPLSWVVCAEAPRSPTEFVTGNGAQCPQRGSPAGVANKEAAPQGHRVLRAKRDRTSKRPHLKEAAP
jgi:hypothetical protein